MELFLNELRHKRYNEDFVCAITWCFQPTSSLFMQYFKIPSKELKETVLKYQTWRHELTVGSWVDAEVYVENREVSGWLQGVIKEIREDNDGLLTIEFPQSHPEHDGTFDRWSGKIAPFGSKTAADYAWREQIWEQEGIVEVDSYPQTKEWQRATILERHTYQICPDRTIKIVKMGYRRYRSEFKSKIKTGVDSYGSYEGFGPQYDNFLPLFNPKIIRSHPKIIGPRRKEIDLYEEWDEELQAANPDETIFFVPRINACISRVFIKMMNYFGNQGGFDMLLDVLENGEVNENLTLSTITYIATLFSMPFKLWHKTQIERIGNRVVEAAKRQFLLSQDKSIRGIDSGIINQVTSAVGNINCRLMDRSSSRKSIEIFKLELIKKLLTTDLLENRIQGIKDLGHYIQEGSNAEGWEAEFLMQWMTENGLFSAIWDPRQTHSQVIQRSDNLLWLLLREKLMTNSLMELFWSLTTSEYKKEASRVLEACDHLLSLEHKKLIFAKI